MPPSVSQPSFAPKERAHGRQRSRQRRESSSSNGEMKELYSSLLEYSRSRRTAPPIMTELGRFSKPLCSAFDVVHAAGVLSRRLRGPGSRRLSRVHNVAGSFPADGSRLTSA